jgi:cytoskeletal protein CcmA (bactofilin family)
MPTPEAFVIPQGLYFEHTAQGLIIEHQGDIVLRGSLGANVHRLVSTDGNIHIERTLNTGEVSALNGVISSDSPLTALKVQAKEVLVGSDLTVEKNIHVSRKLHVHGDVKSDRLQCLGTMEVTGDVHCSAITVEGQASILKNIEASDIHFHQAASVTGSLTCSTLKTGTETITIGTLTADVVSGTASIIVQDGLDANSIECTELTSGGVINSKTIQVQKAIKLTGGSIHSDVVFCASFETQNNVDGKILVLEAKEQIGAHRIKGCLELSDFEDLVPNIDAFLEERGLHIGGNNTTDPEEIEDDLSTGTLQLDLNSVTTTESISEQPAPMYLEEPSDSDEGTEVIGSPARIAVPMLETDVMDPGNDTPDAVNSEEIILEEESSNESNDEDIDVESQDVEALSEEWTYDDQDVLDEIEETELDNPIYEDIRQKIESLSSNYDDKPDAVQDLMTFLDSEDFLTLRDELRQIWSRLLKFHQQENTRIPHPALTAFTELDKHLKQL